MNTSAFLAQPKPLMNPKAKLFFDFEKGTWMIDQTNCSITFSTVMPVAAFLTQEVVNRLPPEVMRYASSHERQGVADIINELVTKLLNQATTDALQSAAEAAPPKRIVGQNQRVTESGWYWYESLNSNSPTYKGYIHKTADQNFILGLIYTKADPPASTAIVPPKPSDIVTTIGHTLFITDDGHFSWERNDKLDSVPKYWTKVPDTTPMNR